MKNTKILTVLGVLLAMGLTACGAKTNPSGGSGGGGGGGGASTSKHTHSWGDWSEVKAATCTEDGSKQRTCSGCDEVDIQVIKATGHDFGEGAEKVDVLNEEGSIKEEMYKCKKCDAVSLRWSALDYDVEKTTARSTSKPESRDSGKAIRFTSTANYQDKDLTKKGCHIVYNVYIPEAAENLSIALKTGKRTDSTLPPVINMVEDDNAKGYEYVNEELVRPDTRYGLKIDGQVVIVPKDESGQEWKDGINWYSFPGSYSFATAGVHEIEFYNLGGYRADFYEFALIGFKGHKHVDKFDIIDAKLNSAGKQVNLLQDSFTNKKAIEIAFKDFTTAPTSPSGTNPWYLAKNTFATWTIGVDKPIEGAKIYFSLECSSDAHLERHLFNEAKYNEAHPDAPVPVATQNPDQTTEDDWRYSVFVGDTNYPILNNDTMKDSGVKATNTQTYVYFADINLAAGDNIVKLSQNNMGYRMKFNQNVRIVYSGDATITGEHAHIWNLTSTTATCTADGTATYKCATCNETKQEPQKALGHNFVVGQAVDGIAPITCSRCGEIGIQFDGFTGVNAGNYTDKMEKNKDFTWAVKMPKAGKVALQISLAYGSGKQNVKIGAAEAYSLKCGETDGTISVNDETYGSLMQQTPTYTFVEMGRVDVTAGDVTINFHYGNNSDRLYSDKLVRLVYLPTAA